jgi:hypothetical protein
MIESVLAKDIDGLEPRLTRQWYNAKVLAELLQCEAARNQIVPDWPPRPEGATRAATDRPVKDRSIRFTDAQVERIWAIISAHQAGLSGIFGRRRGEGAAHQSRCLNQHTVKYTATNPARFEKLWRA